MIKVKFTKIMLQRMLTLAMLVCCFGYTNAQCDVPAVSADLATNPLVIISMDGDCDAAITPDQILEGDFDCYDHFEVVFEDGTPAIVGGEDVGETITVVVNLVDDAGEILSTGWGDIKVEDKVDPIITCPCEAAPEECDLTCEDLDGILDGSITGPVATAVDACGAPVEMTFVDEVTTDGGDCGTTIVTRTFTATDESGNTATCSEDITFRPLTFADVTDLLPVDDILECGATVPDWTPIVTCNISITQVGDDIEVALCGEDEEPKKIIRNFVITNWCPDGSTNTMPHTQTIKVLDTQAPVFTCQDDMTVSTNSTSCLGTAVIERPDVDDCTSVTMTPSSSAGSVTLMGGNWVASGLELGDNTITWTIEDACGNSDECSFTITVEDNIAPIPVCDLHTTVSVGSDGTAEVAAITFDDGSLDNCGIDSYEVRRMEDSSFGPFVGFDCGDIGTTVTVVLKVTDVAGNSNTCMVEVEVDDKIDPIVICPDDKTVECGGDISVAALGMATPIDNCSATVEHEDFGELDDCGVGVIVRVWTAKDAGGREASCEQIITVENNDPFYIADTECEDHPSSTSSDDVDWPCDIELDDCGNGLSPDDLDSRPTVYESTCQNVAVTHVDTQLDFGADDACLKILRKWIIIDWCQVNDEDLNGPNPDPTDDATDGVWHYVQVIKVVNSTPPSILTFDIDIADINDYGVENGVYVVGNVTDDCGSTFVGFNVTVEDDCTDLENLDVTYEFSTGTSGSGLSASDAFVNGSYSITFTVNDGCDNEYSQTKDFVVEDKKQPTPVCYFGLATVVMPTSGAVTIWAEDFQASSFDNCPGELQYSFSADVSETSKIFTCDDVGDDNLAAVTIYVTDAAGNQDFCTTFIQVQDPNGTCVTPTALITGEIVNEYDETVQDVTVKITDGAGMNQSIVTQVDGQFQFAGMTNGSYDVTPEKDLNYLNGVTTYDLVLISKHILGTEVFDTPYKWIAADANNSETITTLDIVKLRALILHIDDELSANTSWRFVDQDFAFAAGSPLTQDYPEYKGIDMAGTTVPANFVAVKIGDVNGTSSVNSLLGTDTRNFNGNLALQLDATKVAAGETFTVDFRANDFNNIAGYQFTLGFDNNKVDFVDVETNLEGLTASNFGLTKLNEGVITTSWNATKGVSVDNDAVLFTMTFLANASVDTEELFEINSRYAASEAYAGSDLYNVVLEFNGATAASGFELYQNTPNPFKAETQIGFNMPEAGAVSLTIYDVSGRVLRLVEMDAAKGFNSINVERAGLTATGVLYYQLETATETATKKMIIVD